MTWGIALFDLDGTLTDSQEGVGNGIVYALASLGIPAPSDQEIKKYLGPPLWYSFREYAGLSEKDVKHVVKVYREYYHFTGQFENRLYPGITQLLTQLQSNGIRLAVATSKIQHSAESIINYFQLDGYFDHVVGSDEHGVIRGTKGLVIQEAIRLVAQPRVPTVMVGDREHDIHGASENGLNSIGVLWGYGHQDELENAGANHIVDSVNALRNLLIS